MSKVNVFDMQGNIVDEIELDQNIFGVEVNTYCMHAALVCMQANARQGTHSTLTKSEVSGGGKKPRRQKGGGCARQGSTRSAQWRHGGIVFGPSPRDYSFTIPKKVKRNALKSALTSKALDGNVIVLKDLKLDAIKTKNMVAVKNSLKVDDSALLVIPGKDENVVKSAANIPAFTTAYVNTINVYDILRHEKLIVTVDALNKISEVYA
ncbi:MAG: 50S ribosomal protein L4 [Clostridia bacterium]|nr:50S ribosomal protein L4 [Clostridia bacterium]MBQ3868292.1 50S ribosomal protein L4 [Clostridia bacterium]MBR0157638.1 50S ribosomal protein L4 [Clostridia bacterium]MBR7062427.1 50S ribosomal protein L4 [Clostridia bacterium]